MMMEVMIYRVEDCEGNKKNQQVVFTACWFCGLRFKQLLQQIEFFGAADGSPAVVHPQLGVNILGMGAYGV